jgi:hypothetical protein
MGISLKGMSPEQKVKILL